MCMQLRSFRSDFIYGLEGRSSLLQRKVKNEWLLSHWQQEEVRNNCSEDKPRNRKGDNAVNPTIKCSFLITPAVRSKQLKPRWFGKLSLWDKCDLLGASHPRLVFTTNSLKITMQIPVICLFTGNNNTTRYICIWYRTLKLWNYTLWYFFNISNVHCKALLWYYKLILPVRITLKTRLCKYNVKPETNCGDGGRGFFLLT